VLEVEMILCLCPNSTKRIQAIVDSSTDAMETMTVYSMIVGVKQC